MNVDYPHATIHDDCHANRQQQHGNLNSKRDAVCFAVKQRRRFAARAGEIGVGREPEGAMRVESRELKLDVAAAVGWMVVDASKTVAVAMVAIQSSRLDFEVVVPMVGEFVLAAMGKLALKLAAEAAGR